MIDFSHHVRFVAGVLLLLALAIFSADLTFGVFIGSAIQSGP